MVHWKENKQTFRDGHAFYHNFHQKSDYWTPQLLRRTAFNFPSQDQRTSKGLKNKGTDYKGENSLIFTKFSQLVIIRAATKINMLAIMINAQNIQTYQTSL